VSQGSLLSLPSLYVPSFDGIEGERGALLSDDRCYRYVLWRRWSAEPPALFIGLNPSTADENTDDPTIRRCIRFARDWGHGGLLMANLYARRSTDPRGLKASLPIGEIVSRDNHGNVAVWRNDMVISALAHRSAVTVAAWGAWEGPVARRAIDVAQKLVGGVHCLGTTKDGHPRHPLYVRADTRPIPWSGQ
jgi:hypothetical protein